MDELAASCPDAAREMPVPTAPLWTRPEAAGVIVSSLLPVAGILFFGWDAFTVVLLYWFENGIIGLFNGLRIAMARPNYRTLADVVEMNPWMLRSRKSPMTQKDWELALRTLVPRYGEIMDSPKQAGLLALLFLGHYSIFMAGHAYLIGRLLKHVPFVGLGQLFAAQITLGFGVAVLAIFVQHAFSFGTDYVQGGRRIRQDPLVLMVRPYYHLLFVHVALLAGCLVISWLSLPRVVAVLLIVLKAGFDLELIRIDLARLVGAKEISWAEMAADQARKYARSFIVRTRVRQPKDSRVTVEEKADGLVLSIPPQGVGLMCGKLQLKGCLLVALFFVLVPGVMAVLIFCQQRDPLMITFGLVLLSGAFVVFVFFIRHLWQAVDFGKRRGSIEVTGGTLTVRQSSALFTKTRWWPIYEVAGVGIHDAEESTDDFRVFELTIRLANGEDRCFFRGREEKELNWIATKLRKAMDIVAEDTEDLDEG